MTYEQIRPQLRSFDIINCRTHWNIFKPSTIFWDLIGHTAVIFRDENTDVLYVYESTQRKNKWGKNGVQLHLMSEWIKACPCRVFVRKSHIKFEISARERFIQHIKTYRGTPYPDLSTRQGRWMLIKSAWDSWLFKNASKNKPTEDSMFCTHLVAHLYEYCRLTSNGKYIASEFEPDDTRPGGKFEEWLIWELADEEIEIVS
jgi:hypothetical protein